MKIAWEGGGEVPQALSGQYTTPVYAKAAIHAWAASKEVEVEIIVKREEDEKRAQQKAAGYVKPEPQHI